MDDEFWDAQPLRRVPVSKCFYGRRHLGRPRRKRAPVRLEWVAEHGLYLVHDGRHRIEWAKDHGCREVLARVFCPAATSSERTFIPRELGAQTRIVKLYASVPSRMMAAAARAVRHSLARLVCREVGHDPSHALAEGLGLPGPICTRCREHCPPGRR